MAHQFICAGGGGRTEGTGSAEHSVGASVEQVVIPSAPPRPSARDQEAVHYRVEKERLRGLDTADIPRPRTSVLLSLPELAVFRASELLIYTAGARSVSDVGTGRTPRVPAVRV